MFWVLNIRAWSTCSYMFRLLVEQKNMLHNQESLTWSCSALHERSEQVLLFERPEDVFLFAHSFNTQRAWPCSKCEQNHEHFWMWSMRTELVNKHQTQDSFSMALKAYCGIWKWGNFAHAKICSISKKGKDPGSPIHMSETCLKANIQILWRASNT